MILVDKGDPRACVFANPKRDGSEWPLTLKSYPGFGIIKQYPEERRAGPWRYTESSTGREGILNVRYEDGNYLKLTASDLVFDVSFWRMETGNTVNFVGGTTHNEKTKQGGGGRDWVINDDGTVSAKHHQHLVLGLRLAQKTASPNTLGLVAKGHPDTCVFEVWHDDGISHAPVQPNDPLTHSNHSPRV